MSSSEEYLESLLQSIMNGEATGSSVNTNESDKPASAIEMLTGEEPEQAMFDEGSGKNNGELSSEEMAEMLTSMVSDLDETDMTIGSDNEITSDIIKSDDISTGLDAELSGMGSSMLDDMTVEDSGSDSAMIDETGLDENFLNDLGLESITFDDSGMGEMALDDANMDEMTLDDFGMSEMALDDSNTGDISLDNLGIDSMAMDESGLDEATLNDFGLDGITLDDSGAADMEQGNLDIEGMATDDLGMSDVPLNDLDMDALSLDDSGVDDMSLSDFGIDDSVQDNSGIDEMGLSDLELDGVTDDLALDDTETDNMGLDDLGLDGMSLDGSGTEDPGMNDLGLDDLGIDDMSLDSLGTDDMGLDDLGLDGMSLDDLETEDPGMNDLGLDDLGIDDMSLDSLGTDDIGLDDLGLDGMTLEESGMDDMSLEESALDSMAIEDNGLDEMTDDFALGEDNMEEDIAEINDLLGQSEQDEEIDDEMLALLESVSDSTESNMDDEDSNVFDFLQSDETEHENTELFDALEKEIQEEPQEESSDGKKKRKWGRKKKKKEKDAGKNAEIDIGIKNSDAEGAENGEKAEKKPGIFARFLAFLTESDEDDALLNENGEAMDENAELLAELSAEDKKAKKEKKPKKEKKAKKGKKGKEGADGEGGEEDGKAAKKKKPKKEKKVKEKDAAAKEKPGKKLSRKKVMSVVLFCATITVGILIITIIIPANLQKRDARIAYDMGNYEETYELLYGKDLSEEDEIILHKSTIILSLDRKLTSYRNYLKIGNNELNALNALIQGAALYHELLPEAEQYNVVNEVETVYGEILNILSVQYGLSEIDVMEIIASEDDVIYTERLTSIVYGISFDDGIGMDEEPEDGAMEDILPEEEEFLEGLADEEQDYSMEGEAFSTEPDANIDDALSDNEEIKYIEPVAVEIHQN